MGRKFTNEARQERGGIRFMIPGAFEDGDEDLIVEVRAYIAGPKGGRAQPLALPRHYWEGIIPKLADRMVNDYHGQEVS